MITGALKLTRAFLERQCLDPAGPCANKRTSVHGDTLPARLLPLSRDQRVFDRSVAAKAHCPFGLGLTFRRREFELISRWLRPG
jgi:hypothetical protein